MKVAILGAGKMGLLHGAILGAMPEVQVCAVADSSRFMLDALACLRPELKTYLDYARLLDEAGPDAAVIASPVSLHVPMALACADRRVPFLVEKPLGMTAQECAPLIEACAKRSLVTMVGFMMRHLDSFAHARAVLRTGALGELVSFEATMYVAQLFRRGKGWRYDPAKSGGGVVIGQAIHLLDLLRWYFGEVERVSARTLSPYSESVEDFCHAQLEFEGGLLGWLDASWSMRHHRLVEARLHVHGTEGELIVTDDELRLFLESPRQGYAAGWTAWRHPQLFRGVEFDVGGPQYTRQDRTFVDAVATRATVECDVTSAYRVQKVVDAIYQSAVAKGEPVDIR